MTENKLNGLVLKDFHEKTLEELSKDFDALVESYKTQKYGVELNETETIFIGTQVLENSSWKGTEVYGIKALRDISVTLEAGKIVLCEREDVRALFHFLNQYASIGTEFMQVQMDVLEKISLVIKEINEVENDVRDASFELEAKRQGIDPEDLRKKQDDMETAQQAAALNQADSPDL